ncbi:unnamed protein product [Lepeophtheirus salmonis]|uniref:(salmon louse) hypothetical protein n=1 Tax=Lepeophtheirus salmonis TaxID=72036 RepID=A0A7R8CAJ7_LEPSM|nr:unnamed protein product [Lepeophtheirus salmonis]CAF2750245.1 unnamed protein product [Lepeophtheirus salmonis]
MWKLIPSKPESGLPTRTIGEYPIKKKFDDNIIESHEIEADLYAIRPRSIDDFELKINADSVIYEDPTIPTFTVSGDVEPESLNRDHSMLKPSRTILDSVTYIGFVDFTTTIDDTVVIFKPKKTYNTVSKSLIMHKIIPTQSVSLESEPFRRKEAIIVDKKIIEHDVIPTSHVNVHLNNVNDHNANANIHQNNVNKLQNNVNVQQNSVNKNRIVPTPTLDSSLQERHRTSEPDIIASSPSIPKITSGINPLKKLLAASASRRNKFNKFTPTSTNKASTISSTEAPSNSVKGDSETSNKKETSNRFKINLNGRPKVNLRPVYKTLYTTYTYFTTFFRASTTRIKSREDIVSNVVTLTNILRPSDLESLKNSCEVDSTCVFATSGPVTKSKGFIGRPNESKREENARRIDSSPINKSVDQEEGSLLKTFYTTYTYFTTLFLEGTSSVSTRTEVYSNIKSSGPPKRLDEVDFTSSSASSRKLEYSSIERGTTTTESPEEQESTISSTLSSVEDLTTINITPSATLKGGSEESEVTTDSQIEESNLTPTPELESAITTPEPLSTEPVVKTYYTTFTYFTTLFRNGTSTVTSNLETITNVGTSSPTLSSSFTPSVTFFTTFTYWTTLIDGDKTITSSSEETRTDILPASVTQDITLPEEKVLFTASPNLPSIDSTSEESKKDSDKETESKKSSKSNRTFTPAIRPNLIRPLGRPVSRPRDPPSRTTVAIITRSDVTPTLIATPVTSPIQPTPTFEEDLKKTSTEASTKSNSLIRPTILSGVRLRRPNPFRERLRERQRQHLNKVRGNSPGVEETQEEEEDLEPQTTPAPRRRARPSFSERRERNKNRQASTLFLPKRRKKQMHLCHVKNVSNFNQDPLTNSATSNTSKRQVRQQNGEGFKPRSSSRFSSRARQRLRSLVAANSLKSTEVNNSPVIYANAITNTPRAGVKEITYQALRATETTQVVFTPTRIRGIRTSFSHVVPSTIYNIQPVSTKIVEQVNQNDLLSTLLLQLLGGAVNKSPNPLLGAQQPQIANLLGRNNAPATQFITHTSTYVTTVSKLDSTIVTITLRGREIKTTLTESQTEVVTATELSTETIIRATPAGANGLGGGFLQTQSPLGSGLNNLPGLGLPDLKQQLLAAQLQQQLLAQQKQLQQQQQALLSEKLALEQLKHKVGKSFPSIDGSKDDKLIMAASSQSEDRVQKIVRVEVNSKVEVNPAPSKKKKREAAMDDNPLPLSHPLHPSPVIQIFPIEPTPFSGSPQI